VRDNGDQLDEVLCSTLNARIAGRWCGWVWVFFRIMGLGDDMGVLGCCIFCFVSFFLGGRGNCLRS